LLKKHLQQLEKYGQAAVKYLKNGKIRYYGKIIPAHGYNGGTPYRKGMESRKWTKKNMA